MGFLMDGLEGEAYDRKYDDRTLVKRIIGYFRPQARRMIGCRKVCVEADVPTAANRSTRGLDVLWRSSYTHRFFSWR